MSVTTCNVITHAKRVSFQGHLSVSSNIPFLPYSFFYIEITMWTSIFPSLVRGGMAQKTLFVASTCTLNDLFQS